MQDQSSGDNAEVQLDSQEQLDSEQSSTADTIAESMINQYIETKTPITTPPSNNVRARALEKVIMSAQKKHSSDEQKEDKSKAKVQEKKTEKKEDKKVEKPKETPKITEKAKPMPRPSEAEIAQQKKILKEKLDQSTKKKAVVPPSAPKPEPQVLAEPSKPKGKL